MEAHTLSRRTFLAAMGSAFACPPEVAVRLMASIPSRTLRVGIVLPVVNGRVPINARDVYSGVTLALAETERSGELFGQQIKLFDRRVATSESGAPRSIASAARELISQRSLAVIIAGTSNAECSSIGRAADEKELLSFNVSCTADFLRAQDCRPGNMYHIAASDAMIAGVRASDTHRQFNAAVELWHASLERYGAAQLNDRFAARFSRPMTSLAWAGWMAVKVAWETSLRAQSVEPAKLLAVLRKEETRFDGHKGAPLSFRKWDNQLRQPVYAVVPDGTRGRVVAEFPDVGRNNEESIRQQLDRFGAGRRMRCPNHDDAETRSNERITGARPEEPGPRGLR